MKKTAWIVSLSVAALIGLAGTASAAPKTCDATGVGSAKAAIDAACPCAGKTDEVSGAVVPWKNHGQYVKCVTRARKSAAKDAGVHKQCLKDVTRCAANSTCGKSAAVACVSTTGTCLNDLNPGDAVAEGTCDADGTACDTDADCSVSTCQIADSAEECSTLGGSPATGTCCSQ